LVDGIPDAVERRQRIAESCKPKCLLIDFAGNAGRHKLVNAADILGDNLPDELVETVKRKAAQAGQPVDVLKALMQAKQKAEDERLKKARMEAKKAQQKQEEAKKRAADRRAGIVAGASYTAHAIDPFDVMDVAPKREPGWHKGRKPTEGQIEALKKFKIDVPEDCSFWQASQLLDAAITRRKAGLSSYSQIKLLKDRGYPDPDKLAFREASDIIGAALEPAVFEQQVAAAIRSAEDGHALSITATKLLRAKPVLSGKRYQRLVEAGRSKRQSLSSMEAVT
jgi:hypothetical protein